ncbi:MAG: SpoIID/LytB domain-containing protein [Bacteroidales bacterium]|nr:SpoIID/LytB domain-containing protein [Bacteroidales bacterium]MCF8390149.1 SpoIID/LytB domain-containing protein [Bacteroidales bacterium]
MKSKTIYILLLLFLFGNLYAQPVRIGLLNDHLVEAFSFHCMEGSFELYSGETKIKTIQKGELIYFSLADKGGILINNGKELKGKFTSLKFIDPDFSSQFSLKMIHPMLPTRFYEGELEVNMHHGVFRLINILDFDHYLAGVVETEAGPGAPDEFFKVQAVLCRTYAVSNWDKHNSEGFNLCDNVHCQAFHGRNDENPAILDAVYSTHDIVVADKSYKLIEAVYHSNSGGETQKAEGFWLENKDYLLSVLDPFSKDQRNYSWEYKTDWKTWQSYFAEMGVDGEKIDNTQLLIKQDHRKTYVSFGKDTVYLKNIRDDFGLKSAFFDTYLTDGKVILKGKGYGHGLGLSQEGAMEMVKKGYSYRDVLNFYYFNIMISDLNDLPVNSVPEIFR